MTEKTTKPPSNLKLFYYAVTGGGGLREKFEEFDLAFKAVIDAPRFSNELADKASGLNRTIKENLGKLFVIASFCKEFYPIFKLVLPREKVKAK